MIAAALQSFPPMRQHAIAAGPQRGGSLFAAAVILLCALFAALFSAVMFAYSDDIRGARERVSNRGSVVDTACGRIEYASLGSGTPLLVVHGAGGGYDQGVDLGSALALHGFRVIAMSRFGYLRTPLPSDASAAAQADAHACLLDALGVAEAAIVGVSAGGPSAMQFALRHPDRCSALVLLVPAAYVPRPHDAPPLHTPAATRFFFETALKSDFLFWAALKLAPGAVTRAILATPAVVVKNASAAEQARVRQVMAHILPVSARRPGLLNDAAIISALPRYELERIADPTLVVSLPDDLFGTFDAARYTAQHVPRARFVTYASGGHVWAGHHDELMSEIAGFLR